MRTSSMAVTTGLADAIRQQAVQAGTDTPAVRGADWQTAIVTAVTADGTVSVGDIVARRLDSYQNPQVGDKIFLSQSGTGNWMAIGRTASATETAFTAYTPTWTADGTAPALGNGALTGRYWKWGTNVVGSINLTIGSTTALGTGSYFWQLPTTIATASILTIGHAEVLTASRWTGQAVISSTDTNKFAVFMVTAAANCALRRLNATTASPDGAFATNNQLRVTFQYEATA